VHALVPVPHVEPEQLTAGPLMLPHVPHVPPLQVCVPVPHPEEHDWVGLEMFEHVPHVPFVQACVPVPHCAPLQLRLAWVAPVHAPHTPPLHVFVPVPHCVPGQDAVSALMFVHAPHVPSVQVWVPVPHSAPAHDCVCPVTQGHPLFFCPSQLLSLSWTEQESGPCGPVPPAHAPHTEPLPVVSATQDWEPSVHGPKPAFAGGGYAKHARVVPSAQVQSVSTVLSGVPSQSLSFAEPQSRAAGPTAPAQAPHCPFAPQVWVPRLQIDPAAGAPPGKVTGVPSAVAAHSRVVVGAQVQARPAVVLPSSILSLQSLSLPSHDGLRVGSSTSSGPS